MPAAETYLQEALDLAIARDDAPGAARGYRLLGRLNIRARELARQAANTYDELWQARNAIARGLLHGVDARLRRVIDDNLATSASGHVTINISSVPTPNGDRGLIEVYYFVEAREGLDG